MNQSERDNILKEWIETVKDKYECRYCNSFLEGTPVFLYEEEVYNRTGAEIVWHLGLTCKKCNKFFIPRKFAEKEFERRGL